MSTGKYVGMDLNLKKDAFCVLSDGTRFMHPQNHKKNEQKLIKSQQILNRKQKGSKNREKARLIHAKKQYDGIARENLKIPSMLKNRRLAKAIFRVMEDTGRQLVKVSPYNTTQKCSGCGEIAKDKKYMTTKLQKKAQSSKLNITKQKKDKVINIKCKNSQDIWSFALSKTSSSDLQELLEKINTLTQRKVNASQLIRALIYLGKESKEEKLLKALKEPKTTLQLLNEYKEYGKYFADLFPEVSYTETEKGLYYWILIKELPPNGTLKNFDGENLGDFYGSGKLVVGAGSRVELRERLTQKQLNLVIRGEVGWNKDLHPIHPGEILREELLKTYQITPQQLAQHLKVEENVIEELIQEKTSLTVDLAYRLYYFFGVSAEYWLNFQRNYDLETYQEKENLKKQIKPYPRKEQNI
ncbi:2740_t:CDS:2 [Entrophospora sp. SA101]|nr:2740_t:CDS:2 [Entrophospora sp. SA101]